MPPGKPRKTTVKTSLLLRINLTVVLQVHFLMQRKGRKEIFAALCDFSAAFAFKFFRSIPHPATARSVFTSSNRIKLISTLNER
jgi:hypothetical protein